MKPKYPWDSLKKIGDTFLTDGARESVKTAAYNACKTRDMKLRVHKIKGGSLVVRIA